MNWAKGHDPWECPVCDTDTKTVTLQNNEQHFYVSLSLSHMLTNLLVIDDTLLSTLYVGVMARGVTLPCFTGSQTFIKKCFLYMTQSQCKPWVHYILS